MQAQDVPTLGEIEIPQMGFGTWNLSRNTAAIQHALEAGYRHLDSADFYNTHDNIAAAIKQSRIPRQELYLVTKLWRHSLEPAKVRPAVKRFLGELESDYIDLLLIHWPAPSTPAEETLAAMQQCVEAGQVRAIGVSNFDAERVARCLEAGQPVANNQIEYNLNKRPDETLAYCQAQGVTVTAYSPLERGSSAQEAAVAEVAQAVGATREQVLLAWLMAKGMVVIPRSGNPAHIDANWASLGIQLSPDQMALIEAAH